MSGEAESKGDVVVLDELTIKQRTKEFKSVQKSLHSKDFAVRLTAFSKISGDSRYFSEGSCLPSFFESLAPTKKLLAYLVPALTWFAKVLQAEAHLPASEHSFLRILLQLALEHEHQQKQAANGGLASNEQKEEDAAIANAAESSPFALSFVHSLLLAMHFREELKKPKIKVSKKKDVSLPPPPMPVENPVYGEIRFLACKCLYYLLLPVYPTKETAKHWFTRQGNEQRSLVYSKGTVDHSPEAVSSTSALGVPSLSGFFAEDADGVKTQELLVRSIPELFVKIHDAAFQHYQEHLTPQSGATPSDPPPFNNLHNVPPTVQSYQNAYYCWKILGLVIRRVDHRATKPVELPSSLEEPAEETSIAVDEEENILLKHIVSKVEYLALLGSLVQDKHLGMSAITYIMALTESLVLEENAWHVFSNPSLLPLLVKLYQETGHRLQGFEQQYQQFVNNFQAEAAAAVGADAKGGKAALPAKKEDPKKGKGGKDAPKEETKPVEVAEVEMTLDTIDMIHYAAFDPQALHQRAYPSTSSSASAIAEVGGVPSVPDSTVPLSVTSQARKESLYAYYLSRIFLRLSRRQDTQSLLLLTDTESDHNFSHHSEQQPQLSAELAKEENRPLTFIAQIVSTLQSYLLSEVVALMMYFPASQRQLSSSSSPSPRQSLRLFEEEDILEEVHVIGLLLVQSLAVLPYSFVSPVANSLQYIRRFLVVHLGIHVTIQRYLLTSQKFFGLSDAMNYEQFSLIETGTHHYHHLQRLEYPQEDLSEETEKHKQHHDRHYREYAERLSALFLARKKAERVFLDLLSYSSSFAFTVEGRRQLVSRDSVVVENHQERYLMPHQGQLSQEDIGDGSTDASRLRRLSHHSEYVSPASLFPDLPSSDKNANYLYFHDEWTQVGPFHLLDDFETIAFAATVPIEDASASNAAVKDAKDSKKPAGKNDKAVATAAVPAENAPPVLTNLPSVALLRYWLDMVFQPVLENHSLKTNGSNSSNSNHVDFDLANRALRMMHLLLRAPSASKEGGELICQKHKVSGYFVSTLGNYLDILLAYYLTQLRATSKPSSHGQYDHHNILLEDGDPSIEEGIYDLFSLLEVLLPASVDSIKQFALGNNAFHKARFQQIQELVYVTGPVLLSGKEKKSPANRSHKNEMSEESLSSRLSLRSAHDLLLKRMQEKRVTVRDPREATLAAAVGVIACAYHHGRNHIAPPQCEYVGYAAQQKHYVKEFARDDGSRTEHRGRILQATHRFHLRGLIWDVLGVLVSADRRFRSVNAAVVTALTTSTVTAGGSEVDNASGAAPAGGGVPAVFSADAIASNSNLSPSNPVQSWINQAVSSECENIAVEIVLLFTDLALQMCIVSQQPSTTASFVTADWFVSSVDGVQVRSLASSVSRSSSHGHSQNHKKLEGASRPKCEEDVENTVATDTARNDVIASALRFMQELSAMTSQGLTAALEGLVQTLVSNPYQSFDHNFQGEDGQDHEEGEKDERTLMGHLVTALSSASTSAGLNSPLTSTIQSFFTVPWTRARYFDEIFPAFMTPEKLFHPSFLLSQPHAWPWMTLVFPLLAVLSNPEAPVSLIEQSLLTLRQCTQLHLSLFFSASGLTHYASVVSDLVAAMFIYLGGGHLLSGQLGTFGLLSDKIKAQCTATRKSPQGQQSLYVYLLSRGFSREQYWQHYHQEIRQQKQAEEEQNKANIDPKTGKPKKDDKKPAPAKKDDKKKDKDGGNAAVKELLLPEIQFNHDEFPAEFYSSSGNAGSAPASEDPNHGPDARLWALLLNRPTHVPQLLSASIPLLHTLILGQVGSIVPPEASAAGTESALLSSCTTSSSIAVLVLSQLGRYISVNQRDGVQNGCTPLMYALLTQDIPSVDALLNFEGIDPVTGEVSKCDVNARDARGNPAMFYACFGLQYSTQCTQLPSMHHPYYTSPVSTTLQDLQHQSSPHLNHAPKQHLYYHYSNAAASRGGGNLELSPIAYRSHALFKPQLHLYEELYDGGNRADEYHRCQRHNHWSVYHLLGHCSRRLFEAFFCHPSVTTTRYETGQTRHHLHVWARNSHGRDGQTLLLTLLGTTTLRLQLAGYTVQIQHEPYHLHDDRYALFTPHNALRTFHRHPRRDSRPGSGSGNSNSHSASRRPSAGDDQQHVEKHGAAAAVAAADEDSECRQHTLDLLRALSCHLCIRLHPDRHEDDGERHAPGGSAAQHRHAIDANQCDAKGLSPLCVALCQRDVALVRYLVQSLGVEVNMIDEKGFHVLHHLVATAPHAFHRAAASEEEPVTQDEAGLDHLMRYYAVPGLAPDSMTLWQHDVSQFAIDLFDLIVSHAENRPLVPFAFDVDDDDDESEGTNSGVGVGGGGGDRSSTREVERLASTLDSLFASAFSPLQSAPSTLQEDPAAAAAAALVDRSGGRRPGFRVGKRLVRAELLSLTRQRTVTPPSNHTTWCFENSDEYNLLMLVLAGPALLTPLLGQSTARPGTTIQVGSYEHSFHHPLAAVLLSHQISPVTSPAPEQPHYVYDDVLPSRYASRSYNGDASITTGAYARRHWSIQREKHLRLLGFLHIWHRLEELVEVEATYAGENLTLRRSAEPQPLITQLLAQTIVASGDEVDDVTNDGAAAVASAVTIVHCLAVACASQSGPVTLTPAQQRCRRLVYFVHPEQAVLVRVRRHLQSLSAPAPDDGPVSPLTRDGRSHRSFGEAKENDEDGERHNRPDHRSLSLWQHFVHSRAPTSLLHVGWDRRLSDYWARAFPRSAPSTTTPLALSLVQNNLDLVDLFYDASTTTTTATTGSAEVLRDLQPIVWMALVPVGLGAGDLLHNDLTSLFVDLASHRHQKEVARELLSSDIACHVPTSVVVVVDNDEATTPATTPAAATTATTVVTCKAWHLAVRHGQVSLLASLLDCPKIDVNSPMWKSVVDGGGDSSPIAADTLVSFIMKRAMFCAHPTSYSSSSSSSHRHGHVHDHDHDRDLDAHHSGTSHAMWRMLDAVRDRLDFSVRYDRHGHLLNVLEDVLFSHSTTGWEQQIDWLAQLVELRRNDVLTALLAPVPAHVRLHLPTGSSGISSSGTSGSNGSSSIYEAIMEARVILPAGHGEGKVLRAVVQELLQDVLPPTSVDVDVDVDVRQQSVVPDQDERDYRRKKANDININNNSNNNNNNNNSNENDDVDDPYHHATTEDRKFTAEYPSEDAEYEPNSAVTVEDDDYDQE